MKKFILGIIILTSFSAYSDCVVSLPYDLKKTEYLLHDGGLAYFTSLDDYSRKRGVILISNRESESVDAKITHTYTLEHKKNLLCGKRSIKQEYLQVLNRNFKGFRDVTNESCEDPQVGTTMTRGLRKAVRYISKNLNCLSFETRY